MYSVTNKNVLFAKKKTWNVYLWTQTVYKSDYTQRILIVPSHSSQFQTGPFIFQGKENGCWLWYLITPLPQCARSWEKWWQTVLQNCLRCTETIWLKLDSITGPTGCFNYSHRSGQEKIKCPVTVCGSVCSRDKMGSLERDLQDKEMTVE